MDKPLKRNCLDLIKPYVPGKPVEEVERELGLTNVVKLASNENPLGPSPLALHALRDNLERLHYYPDGNCYYLKEALANKLNVEPEQLIIGNGSDELLSLIAAAYINPGDEGIMAQPTFSEYEFAMRLMGGIPRYIPLEGVNFNYNLSAMRKAFNRRTRLVFICTPNNPTGTVVTKDELDSFLDSLPSGVLVILDQAYYEYITGEQYKAGLEYIREGRPVILLRTFSKIYGLAGLRVGYGIAPSPVIDDLNRVREPFNVNCMAQTAAMAALNDTGHLELSRDLVVNGRKQLAEGLKSLGLTPVPSQANFYFVDIKTDSRRVFKEMLKRGVIVRTGDIFGYPSYIRVTFGTEEQNRRFIETLQEVLDMLKQ